ncbi:MAG: hypothetical protein IPG43_14390 [Proteobacteria bacterium]|nr:hypothetical protein [Pseudomonadota bacterium]
MHKSTLDFSTPAVLLAAALAVGNQAQAEVVFPPPHLANGANVVTGIAQPGRPTTVPWYFGAQAQLAANLAETVSRAPTMASNATVGPWYRAAN